MTNQILAIKLIFRFHVRFFPMFKDSASYFNYRSNKRTEAISKVKEVKGEGEGKCIRIESHKTSQIKEIIRNMYKESPQNYWSATISKIKCVQAVKQKSKNQVLNKPCKFQFIIIKELSNTLQQNHQDTQNHWKPRTSEHNQQFTKTFKTTQKSETAYLAFHQLIWLGHPCRQISPNQELFPFCQTRTKKAVSWKSAIAL